MINDPTTRTERGHPGRNRAVRSAAAPRILPHSCVVGSAAGGTPARLSHRRAFTLVELILVMVLLSVVLAVAAPSLSRFFRGRSLDSETKRFLALTRYGQSRAVSEGLPMLLWFDTKQRTYGLRAEAGYTEEDAKAQEFVVDERLEVEVEFSGDAIEANRSSQFQSEKQTSEDMATIRFTPDGFISESSPERVVFRQGDDGELWVAQSRNRLSYEIQASQTTNRR